MIGAYKLTEQDVVEIKELFKTTKLTDTQIGKLYNVSRVHINCIRNGRRWNDDTRSFFMKSSSQPIVYQPEIIFDTTLQRPVPKKKTLFQKTCRSLAIFFLSLS